MPRPHPLPSTSPNAAEAIERRKIPEDGRARVRPFMRALSELRRDLLRAGRAASRADAAQTNRAMAAAAGRLPALERAARRAGVSACGDTPRLTALRQLDGLDPPSWAKRLYEAT